jgi:ParB family transcriptional regulator, chromosome partitioning protein
MARGTRINLAELAGAVGDNSPVDKPGPAQSGFRAQASAKLEDLVTNPRNPRDDLGDLDDLATIVENQLQPVLVVTRAAYLRIYPEDQSAVAEARWVVINGCRRFAAAEKFGRPELDIVVKDEVAKTRIALLAAAVIENVARRDFDVLEEAKAVELLVGECGSAVAAAKTLSRTQGWVSQRRALLNLAPELQAALRAGDLAVRDARSLAQVPLGEQVAAWQAERDEGDGRDAKGSDAAGEKPIRPRPRRHPADARKITRALQRFEVEPTTLAKALRDYLDEADLHALRDALDGIAAL